MRPIPFCLALVLMAAPAAAQRAPADLAEGGRFALETRRDGVLRVDRQTGATSQCREQSGRWSCEAVPDERQALEAEIGRLADENARLRQRVAELEKSTGNADDRPSLPLPSRKDVEQVLGFFEDVMRRVGATVEWLRREWEGQGG